MQTFTVEFAMRQNIGTIDRSTRMLIAIGICPAYAILGISTCRKVA